MDLISWLLPTVLGFIQNGVQTGMSAWNTSRTLAAQKEAMEREEIFNKQQAEYQKLQTEQNKRYNNEQFSNQFASNLNRGISTGLLSNQMPAGTGIGVQGLNGAGYLNEDNVMAKVGGLFSKKVNAKDNVRDDNNLYFDRIEYAKCGGRFKRK